MTEPNGDANDAKIKHPAAWLTAVALLASAIFSFTLGCFDLKVQKQKSESDLVRQTLQAGNIRYQQRMLYYLEKYFQGEGKEELEEWASERLDSFEAGRRIRNLQRLYNATNTALEELEEMAQTSSVGTGEEQPSPPIEGPTDGPIEEPMKEPTDGPIEEPVEAPMEDPFEGMIFQVPEERMEGQEEAALQGVDNLEQAIDEPPKIQEQEVAKLEEFQDQVGKALRVEFANAFATKATPREESEVKISGEEIPVRVLKVLARSYANR